MPCRAFGPWTSARTCSSGTPRKPRWSAVGRRSSFVLLVLGVLLTPILLAWEKGVLDFVLSAATILGPPVAVVSLVGFFWPRAHGRAATVTLVFGIAAGVMMWVIADAGQVVPEWIRPVLNRAGIGGLLSLVVFALGTFAIRRIPRNSTTRTRPGVSSGPGCHPTNASRARVPAVSYSGGWSWS